MEAARTSETSVYSNNTTRRYFPEGSNLHDSLVIIYRFPSLKHVSLGTYFNKYTHQRLFNFLIQYQASFSSSNAHDLFLEYAQFDLQPRTLLSWHRFRLL
jgi:hypothetical protein